MTNFEFFSISIIIVIAFLFFRHKEKEKKIAYINNYCFPVNISYIVKEIYPSLSDTDMRMIEYGLKEYFKLYLISRRRSIAVPSLIIHRAWCEFMNNKQEYSKFCNNAFGHFLYHTSLETMEGKNKATIDLKIVWTLACYQEGIIESNLNKLPVLFSLDSSLNIVDGVKYTLSQSDNKGFCAKNIGFLEIDRAKGGNAF